MELKQSRLEPEASLKHLDLRGRSSGHTPSSTILNCANVSHLSKTQLDFHYSQTIHSILVGSVCVCAEGSVFTSTFTCVSPVLAEVLFFVQNSLKYRHKKM